MRPVGPHARGRARRASAVVLTAAIGATVAALPAGPASAQSADWTPPPDAGVPVSDLRMDSPPEDYQKESECVEAAQLDEVQQLRNAPWGQQYLRLAEVHRTMEAQGMRPGAGQNVSVIDTGVWDGHQYFQGRVHGIGEYVKKEQGRGEGVVDCDGHGTEVAGIIGARTPNDVGFTGVAPYSTIKSIRQSSESYQKNDEETQQPGPGGGQGDGGGQGGDGGGQGGDGGQGDGGGQGGDGGGQGDSGGQGGQDGGQGGDTGGSAATDSSQRQAESSEGAGTIESLAAAIVKAADDSPNSVMNVSINNCQPASGPNLDEQNQKLQAAVKYASEEKDVVVVSAAGNVGENCEQNTESDPDKLKSYVSPPIFSDHVLSVGAIDEGGGVANFSMNGPWVGVAAPGTDIISLDPAEGSNRLVNQTIDPNGEAAPIEGTSFAAPYVSGLAVLVRQMHPGLSAEQVMDRIKYTAHHPAASDGHDQYIGQGVIDPVAALTGRVPAEENEQPVQPQALPNDLPPAHDPNETPFAVAVGGSAAALLAIGITMFVVHTVRRNQKPTQQGSDKSGSAGPR